MRHFITCCLVASLTGAVLSPSTARAQVDAAVVAPSDKGEAKRIFALGVSRAKGGDYEGAIRAFDEAYALLPHPLIQYNLGLAYEKQGDPVQAVTALRRAIAGAPPLPPQRAEVAQTTLSAQTKLIAKLRLRCNVEGAEIRIDGERVGAAPLEQLPVVGARRLTVEARAPGYMPHAQVVSAAPGTSAEIVIQLDLTKSLPGAVRLETKLVGADVYVDGKLVAVTPVRGDIAVTPGAPHRVELRRPGYRTRTDSVTVGSGLEATVSLEPEIDPDVLARGQLEVTVEPADATLRIDGAIHQGREMRLPPGPHAVSLSRTGYESAHYTVWVAEDDITTVAYRLQPLTETLAALVSEAHTRDVAGYALTIGGAAFAAAGMGVLLFTRGFDNDVSAEEHLRDNNLAPYERCGAPTIEQQQFCTDEEARIGSRRYAATGLYVAGGLGLGLGAAFITTGLVLLTTGERPDAPRGDELDGHLMPILQLGPDGGSLQLRGAF